MRILTAFVDDPSFRGRLESPLLIVRVDEWPDRTFEPDNLAGGWTIARYGPFMAYTDPSGDAEAGDFNVKFPGRFPPLVDIGLELEDGETRYDFALPLRRARQLVRKHDANWRLLLNDHDAQHGKMSWLPVETQPGCREWDGYKTCGRKPTKPIRIQLVDVPLCPEHVHHSNTRHASERIAQPS